MAATVDARTRLDTPLKLLLDVDQSFESYDLEFTPEQALAAALTLGQPRMAEFIHSANALARKHGADRSYSIRLGRRFGAYIVSLECYKGTFPNACELMVLIESKAKAYGAFDWGTEDGNQVAKAWAKWE